MTSQTDLDQGGTSRAWVRTYLGPSVGWQWVPANNVLPITAAGTFNIDPSTNLITVNVAGAVIIILPTAILPASAQAQPCLFAQNPITIVDIGGHAQASPITIKPKSVSENIVGLAQIQLTTNYGGFTLVPNSTLLGWNVVSP